MRAWLLLVAVGLTSGCAQTVLVHAPPGARLQVEEEPPVVVPAEGRVEVDVPVGYLDPGFSLAVEHDAPAVEGHLARTALNGWVAVPIASATLCASLPLAGVGFCLANPAVPVSLCLAGSGNSVLLGSAVATVGAAADAPTWATIPTAVLCAGSAGVCLFAMPFALRVSDEIVLERDGDTRVPAEDDAPPLADKEAMLW